MKRSFWVWCLFIAVNAYGQNRTNVWELSYSTNLLYPNCEMLFFNNVVDTQSVYRTMSFLNTNASICDTNGHILFYTNGLTVGNANYDTLQNADNFNSGYATSDGEPYGLGACQGALFLPYPGQNSLYILFHITGESFFSNGQDEIQPLYLSYSMIDLHLDNGLGAIVDSQKNIQIINDTLTWGRITASKHANGMDWWVIIHRYYSDQYYKLLVTSEGITGPYIQSIGSTVTKDIFGQACFSPDGSRYAMVSQVNVLDYMEFDRCTGEFFNSQTIYVPDSIWTIGCSFSPSGRFLYVSSQTNVFQYDTWSNNMSASVLTM